MSDYTLKLSEFERMRFRMMAATALDKEGDLWERAGIVKGARVVDVGCGPGAVLVELARLVGPEGRVVGVDQDAEARQTATAWAAEEGLANVEVRAGLAADTGLSLGEWDAAMMRHVLLHNGPTIGAILAHVLALLKPAGHAVLDETAFGCVRYERDLEPDLQDLEDRYAAVLASQGNDLEIGPHLAAHGGPAVHVVGSGDDDGAAGERAAEGHTHRVQQFGTAEKCGRVVAAPCHPVHFGAASLHLPDDELQFSKRHVKRRE